MRRRDEEALAPDLTPRIDVVFILLIFFLVSSVFKKQELALLLNLPSSQYASEFDTDKKDVTIEVKKNEVAINGKITPLSGFESILKEIDPKSTIHIRYDQETLYVQIIDILNILKKLNLTNINLVTAKK